MKKIVIPAIVFVLCGAGLAIYWFVFRTTLADQIVMPYIAHQKPRIDPHVPSAVPIADKLDEAVFDGIFNVSANSSGIIYEDGLGEYLGIDPTGIVSIRLKPKKEWHSSYSISLEKKKFTITPKEGVLFTARDLKFSLERIARLGSLSPDNVLVSQAIPDFGFSGPDDDGVIKFQFRPDRIWTESDVKEVLSFKVIPYNSELDAPQYTTGTGPYMFAGDNEDALHFLKMPQASVGAGIANFILKPFIDNSTYTTELKNHSINMLLSTPFGAISPILHDSTEFFYKSSIATTFFAILYNTERLNLAQRQAMKSLINNQMLMNRFFKVGTAQQRHIANYKGENDNYEEYLNYSVFPTSSYYIEDTVVTPLKEIVGTDISVLPDTVRIQTCVNYEYREELSEMMEILNDPAMFHGKIKATAVSNDQIKLGQYDAVLVPITGYRSNFLFDLYTVFLREPNFAASRINLKTAVDPTGKVVVDDASFSAEKNFFRIDLGNQTAESADQKQLLNYVYGFMSTREIGDKQAYAQFVDQLDQKLALGSWLFSLPSLAYASTQFDEKTIDMYGAASQLSTIEKWREGGVKKR